MKYSSRYSCNTAHSSSIWSIVSVWPQRWQELVILGTRYGTWWPWCGQFEVGLLQPLHLELSAGISSVAPVSVFRDRDLCHVQIQPTWFEPTAECRSWPVASNLYSGHFPKRLCLGQRSLLLVGPLFNFPQCHNGLVSSRNEHVCPCHSITRAGLWYGKQKDYRWLHLKILANRTLSQTILLHTGELDSCIGSSSVPEWWL